jgi:hypothetical protein
MAVDADPLDKRSLVFDAVDVNVITGTIAALLDPLDSSENAEPKKKQLNFLRESTTRGRVINP